MSNPLTRKDITRLLNLARQKNTPLDLKGANLEGTDLSDLDLTGANLQDANISRTNLKNTDLSYADLRQADATGTSFIDAILVGARIHGMRFKEASLPAYVFRLLETNAYILGDWEYAKKTGDIRDYHYAREVALELKKHLSSSGRNFEAIWAFELEQRIVRELINPWRRIRWYQKRGKRMGIIRFLRFGLWWLLSWIADLTTGYGEKIDRVIITFVITQAIFIIGYWQTNSIVDINGNRVTDLFSAILFGLAAMTTTNLRGLFPANQLVELFMSIQVVIGIAITGLLGFVLGNRIRYSA